MLSNNLSRQHSISPVRQRSTSPDLSASWSAISESGIISQQEKVPTITMPIAGISGIPPLLPDTTYISSLRKIQQDAIQILTQDQITIRAIPNHYQGNS